MNAPSGRPGPAGRYLSCTDAGHRKAKVKLGTNSYNWGCSRFKASTTRYSLLILFTITNAVVIPMESLNGIGPGDTNPELDSNRPSNAGNTAQPAVNQISGGLSAMDVMVVVSVTMLALLVYLSTRKPRDPHINLGLSLLAAIWIHWTVFSGDASMFLFSM